MEHLPFDEQTWVDAGPEHFTGAVEFNSLSEPDTDEGLKVLAVRFAPTARTDWHSHPGGQVLYVVSGTAVVQEETGDRVVTGPGGVVRTPPGEVHWHGAGPEGEMVHLSLTSHGVTDWGPSARKVSDAEYSSRPPGTKDP